MSLFLWTGKEVQFHFDGDDDVGGVLDGPPRGPREVLGPPPQTGLRACRWTALSGGSVSGVDLTDCTAIQLGSPTQRNSARTIRRRLARFRQEMR